MPDTTARIFVHPINQLRDGTASIPFDVTGNPLSDGYQFVIDHQHAMIHALDVALDQHTAPACVFTGSQVGRVDLLILDEINRDAAAMICVQRFDHNRVAYGPGRSYCLAFRENQPLLRHGQAQIPQQIVRVLLVTGNFYRDVRGLAGDRGLDALLESPVSELHQGVLVEP